MLAPPGDPGAVSALWGRSGAALLAKEETKSRKQPHFIGLDQMESLTWQQEANVPCPFCMNHCQRAVVRVFEWNLMDHEQPL